MVDAKSELRRVNVGDPAVGMATPIVDAAELAVGTCVLLPSAIFFTYEGRSKPT